MSGVTDHHKSSEDLVREAKERLRSTPPSPEPEALGRPSEPDQTAPTTEPTTRSYEKATPVDPVESSTEAPTSRSGLGSAITANVIRLGLVLLLTGGWFLITRLDDASRDETGQITSGGDLDVMAMQVGDCFDDPEGDEDMVVGVAAVPCSEPHDNEVFAVLSLSAVFADGGFPGDDALWDHSYEVCSGSAFDSYVGTHYLESSLEVFSFTPSEESWSDGDREFVCVLYSLDFAKLTGTARGSGL